MCSSIMESHDGCLLWGRRCSDHSSARVSIGLLTARDCVRPFTDKQVELVADFAA